MCFAKYLKSQKLDVDYMGLFDPVSRDASMVVYRTLQVESNVKSVRVAFRSPKIGSRRTSMNRIALDSTVGKPVHRRECPGSHGALGGFPNGAGTLDKPHWGQGHPEYPTKFHPEKEFTAWWQSGHFISEGAKKQEVPVKSLVPDERARFCLPRSEWYTTVEYKDTVTRREPHRPRM